MSADDRIRIEHMIDAAETALRFVREKKREDLDAGEMLVFALARAVEIVGEAASRVSPAGRSELADIPWTQIVGMRHRLDHAYFDIDRTILWDTVTLAIPDLLVKLRAW